MPEGLSDHVARAYTGRTKTLFLSSCLITSLMFLVVLLGCHGKNGETAQLAHIDEKENDVGDDRASFEEQQQMLETQLRKAIIYARKQTINRNVIRWQVVWQQIGISAHSRIIYKTLPTNIVFSEMPRDFGFMPSPDGTWLCLWEPSGHQEHNSTIPNRTAWRLIRIPQGEAFDIGDSVQGSGYLPYWLDETTLVLEKGDYKAIYNVGKLPKSQRLQGPPTWGDWNGRDIDQDDSSKEAKIAARWRREYIDRHYKEQVKCLKSALLRLDQKLRFGAYLRPRRFPTPDNLYNLLMRPMGIVSLWGFNYSKRCWPSVAVTQDCQLLARAGVIVTGSIIRINGTTGQPEQANTVEAKLDVYDVPTGRHVWGTQAPWQFTTTDDVVVLPMPRGQFQWYTDLRWSRDMRYLSFTCHDDAGDHDNVTVVDSTSWKEILKIPNASNAFVVSYVPEEKN